MSTCSPFKSWVSIYLWCRRPWPKITAVWLDMRWEERKTTNRLLYLFFEVPRDVRKVTNHWFQPYFETPRGIQFPSLRSSPLGQSRTCGGEGRLRTAGSNRSLRSLVMSSSLIWDHHRRVSQVHTTSGEEGHEPPVPTSLWCPLQCPVP